MGCASSKDKVAPDPNGNHVVSTDKVLRGDVIHQLESKHQRQMKMREKQVKIFSDAEHISDRIMEEKERLSLPDSQSRATSIATSRMRSPTGEDTKNQNMDVNINIKSVLVSGSDLTDTPSTSTQLPGNNDTNEPVEQKRLHKKKKSKSKSDRNKVEALETGNVINEDAKKSDMMDTTPSGEHEDVKKSNAVDTTPSGEHETDTLIPNGVQSTNSHVIMNPLPEITA